MLRKMKILSTGLAGGFSENIFRIVRTGSIIWDIAGRTLSYAKLGNAETN